MDDTQTLLKMISSKASVRVELGYYRALAYPRVIVDIGGGRIPAEVATSYRPVVNEQVQVLFVDGKPWLLGPAVPHPAEGTVVTAPSAGMVKVLTDVGDVSATYPFGASLSSGQQVKLMWSNGPHVVSVMSTTPVTPVDPGAGGGGGGGTRQEVFTAVQAGAWQLDGARWSSDQPRASNGYLGAWHFGTKIPDTVPANAQLVSIEQFHRYASKSGNAPNFALHSQATRGGAPDVTSSFPWNVVDGWNTFPAAQAATFFNALKAGGGKLGISLNHGGVNRFASLGEEPQSGQLRITWRT